MSGYKDLDIYKISYSLAKEAHKISLQLPKFELYETGSQIRRSSKSISANIVEGYGRSKYKNEFIRFLVYAHASNDETLLHLNFIKDLYKDIDNTENLIHKFDSLGKKINSFINYVEKNWNEAPIVNS